MRHRLLAGLFLWGAVSATAAAEPEPPPYGIAPGLFAAGREDLGLARPAGVRTATVFRPAAGTDHYANGAAVAVFRGRWFVQWQSSAQDEDSPDTWVAYSTSADGETWSPPRALSAAAEGGVMRTSGGWWTDGATLVAFVNVWPRGFGGGAGGHTEYRTSGDGERWSEPRRLGGRDGRPFEGVIEQDIHAYDGRLHTAFHVPPGLVAKPFHSDDPLGTGGWTEGALRNLEFKPPTSRELEPSLFRRAHDGALVMVFRDQASTYRQLAAVSTDRGATWSTPVPTAMPDARAKQSAGNLPDGTAFLVNCPSGTRERVPLAVTLGRDGHVFDRSLLLRGTGDLPPLRYPGKYKRPGYHYPKSLVADGFLYVVYATNKEDVELTRVPLSALAE